MVNRYPISETGGAVRERDLAVLEHVSRYRLTVMPALERLPCFAGVGTEAVKSVLKRLCAAGDLQSAPLYRKQRYYYLGPRAAQLLGERRSAAQPLQEEPKLRAYATLAFCCLAETPRERLTTDEFRTQFAELYRPGERINYYLDTEGDRPRLAALRIDYALRGRWDRVIGSCVQDVARRCDVEAFRKLVDAGGFQMTVLTALEQKAERLQAAIAETELPVPIRVAAVPGLLELLP